MTFVDTNHTRKLEPMVQRRAIQSSAKLATINLTSMKGVIDFLRKKTHASPSDLRLMLAPVLPRHCALTTKFINDFRRRAMNYLIQNDHCEELTMGTALILVSKDANASEEFVQNLDDPIIMQNFIAILRTTMSENKTTWKAISTLDKIKSNLGGFDCRV